MKKFNIATLQELSSRANQNLEWFWEEVDKEIGIIWDEPYTQILDTKNGIPWSKWFVNGKTNIYKSSVEKFVKEKPNKTAYTFVSEDGSISKITYSELDQRVNKLANGLKQLGVKKGDVIAIYLPMIEESILAILASAKIGAVQTVIFSGYSSESLQIRLNDCKAKILFVCDGFQRNGKPISQKQIINDAIKETKIEKIIVIPYKGIDVYDESKKFISYYSLMDSQNLFCPTEIVNSEDPLFILYTSGTTGKPKGVVHTHGGFSVFAGYQSAFLIDMNENDVILWPADIGWITGLVWNVYGLLIRGASGILYDGSLNYPNFERIWDMLYQHNATIFGISPTAVRLFKKNNIEPLKFHSFSKIKNIPTTGEPLDEDSWWWLFEKVGNRKIPIMNLSGGTEIGGAMLSVFPGMKLKPSTVGMPCPGMNLDVFDDDGKSVRQKNGYLVIKSPWPAMTRGLLNDDDRYLQTYWSHFENVWFHGDYVFVDMDGLWYMQGRTDDVINVSGHRLSTAAFTWTYTAPATTGGISMNASYTGAPTGKFVLSNFSNQLSAEAAAATSSQWSQAASRVGILISGIPNPINSVANDDQYGKWGIGIINPLDRAVDIYAVGIMSESDGMMDKIIAGEPSSGWFIRDLGAHDVVIWESGGTPFTIPAKSVGQFRVQIEVGLSNLFENTMTIQALTSEGKLTAIYTVLSNTGFPLFNTFYTTNALAPLTNWTYIISNVPSNTAKIFNATIENAGASVSTTAKLLILIPADFTNVSDYTNGTNGWGNATINQNPDGSNIISVTTTSSTFAAGDYKTYQFKATTPTVSTDKLYVFQTTTVYPQFNGTGKSQLASALSEAGVEVIP